MARKPMVTRTIQSTKCTFMCADTTTAEVCNKTVVLPRTYKDEKALIKAGKSAIETDTLKVVAVVDTEVCNELYGMDEATFIANAAILDPETRKALQLETCDEPQCETCGEPQWETYGETHE